MEISLVGAERNAGGAVTSPQTAKINEGSKRWLLQVEWQRNFIGDIINLKEIREIFE